MGQDFIEDCNIIYRSLLWQCVRSCVLCVHVATRLIYMILVPWPVVNDATATSLCQSYYEKVYPEHSHRQLYIFFLYNTNLILKNMCNFKDCRRLCSYILEHTETAKNSQTTVDFALEKLRNEIINAQTSSLKLVFQM